MDNKRECVFFINFITTLEELLDNEHITEDTRFNLTLSSGQTYTGYRLLYESDYGIAILDDDNNPVIVNKDYIMSISING